MIERDVLLQDNHTEMRVLTHYDFFQFGCIFGFLFISYTNRFIKCGSVTRPMRYTQLFDTNQKKFLWTMGVALIIFGAFLMQEPTIGPGDTVVLNYTISINGVIVDTSSEEVAQRANIYNKDRTYEPLVTVIGGMPSEGAVAPLAVERQLLGMKVGEEKVIRLYPMEAYGYFDPDKIIKISKAEFIQNTQLDPQQGDTLQWGPYIVNVYQVTEEFVYLDFNHRFVVKANEVVVPRGEFEKSAEAYVGNKVLYQGVLAIVMRVTDTDVVLDINPAVFEFKIEIVQIKKA